MFSRWVMCVETVRVFQKWRPSQNRCQWSTSRRSTQTFLYFLTYIWRPGRNSVSSWLDHVGSSDVQYNMLSQLNVSTGLKKLLFRLAPLVDTAHGMYSSPEKSETAPIELLGIHEMDAMDHATYGDTRCRI